MNKMHPAVYAFYKYKNESKKVKQEHINRIIFKESVGSGEKAKLEIQLKSGRKIQRTVKRKDLKELTMGEPMLKYEGLNLTGVSSDYVNSILQEKGLPTVDGDHVSIKVIDKKFIRVDALSDSVLYFNGFFISS